MKKVYYCWSVSANPSCQLSLWEETGVPGGNPQQYISISVLCSIPPHPSPLRTLYRNFINRKRCYFSTFSDEKNTVSIKDKIMAASGGVLVILIIIIIGLLVKYRREKKSDQEAPLLDQQVCFSFSFNHIYVSWIQFATYFCHFHNPIAIKRSSLFVTRLFQRIQ